MTSPRTERRVLGGAVRRIREAYGYKLEIAAKAGMSGTYWCNIEAGRKNPTIAKMIAMAQVLKVDLDDITYTTIVEPKPTRRGRPAKDAKDAAA